MHLKNKFPDNKKIMTGVGINIMTIKMIVIRAMESMITGMTTDMVIGMTIIDIMIIIGIMTIIDITIILDKIGTID